MMRSAFIFFFCFYLLNVIFALKGKSPDEAPGVVLLDAITFPKVVPNANAHVFVLFLDKGDIGQPTTDGSRDNFLEVSRDKDVDDDGLLFAQVLVNGADNLKLKDRMGVTNMPQLLFFPKGSSESITYPVNAYINGVNTRRFVTKHTGVIYSTPGSIWDFDEKALGIVKASSKEEKVAILVSSKKTLEDKKEGGLSEDTLTVAEEYIRVMEKIIERGNEYVQEELERLTTLLKGKKISDKKKANFTDRRNVLHHFDFNLETILAGEASSSSEL